jgi:hypothetical protein
MTEIRSRSAVCIRYALALTLLAPPLCTHIACASSLHSHCLRLSALAGSRFALALLAPPLCTCWRPFCTCIACASSLHLLAPVLHLHCLRLSALAGARFALALLAPLCTCWRPFCTCIACTCSYSAATSPLFRCLVVVVLLMSLRHYHGSCLATMPDYCACISLQALLRDAPCLIRPFDSSLSEIRLFDVPMEGHSSLGHPSLMQYLERCKRHTVFSSDVSNNMP